MKLDLVSVRPALPFLADAAAPVAVRDPIAWLLDVLGAWFTHRAAQRRERLAYASLARLDAATLRDLGIHRSEIGSVDAEWRGEAASTRRRIAPRNVEVFTRA